MNKIGIKNLAPKVISILFALVLWIYVMGAINPRTTENIPNIPVNLINIEELKDQGLVLVGNDDFKARVKLTGRRDEIYKVTLDQIQIKADLRGYRVGTNNVPLEVSVPNNIEADVSPRFIRVELEEIVKKQRGVKVIVTGTPKENFAIGQPQYKPTVVWVEGPESYVNSVENVVATLDVTGESNALTLSLPLKPVNSRGEEVKNVDVKTSYADIYLDIGLLKSVPIKVNHNITAADGYEITNIEMNPKNIMLKGKEEILNTISEVETEMVEAKNLTKNENIEIKLNLPQEIIAKEDIPTMKISVEKIEHETFKIDKGNIVFNNLDENLKIDKTNIPESINITISALKDVLNTIEEDDIHIVVDLNNLSADEYTIEPVVNIPFMIQKGIKKLSLEPKTLDIKLIEKQD